VPSQRASEASAGTAFPDLAALNPGCVARQHYTKQKIGKKRAVGKYPLRNEQA
jgi:hypothetical protein